MGSHCYAQLPVLKFNLDFEQGSPGNKMPDKWFKWGTFELGKDSVMVHSGKYAALITSNGKSGEFGSIALKIPANYKGEEISLQGYMKL